MDFYQVKSGDSLVAIAREVLGDSTRWRDIARLNEIDSPYLIRPGQTLTMPDTTVLGPVVVPAKPPPAGQPAPAPEVAPGPYRAGIGFDIEPETMTYLALGALLLFLVLGKK